MDTRGIISTDNRFNDISTEYPITVVTSPVLYEDNITSSRIGAENKAQIIIDNINSNYESEKRRLVSVLGSSDTVTIISFMMRF